MATSTVGKKSSEKEWLVVVFIGFIQFILVVANFTTVTGALSAHVQICNRDSLRLRCATAAWIPFVLFTESLEKISIQ
jgi:hypothetical protein